MENKIEGVCYICGEPLVWDENAENCSLNDCMEYEEDAVVKEIKCKHCGTVYQYFITKDNDPDSKESHIICGDQGFGNCAHCGGIVAWSGDFMRSDFYNDPADGEEEQLQEDDNAIVRSLVCSHCGCYIEVWEPSPNEMRSGDFPYWNE